MAWRRAWHPDTRARRRARPSFPRPLPASRPPPPLELAGTGLTEGSLRTGHVRRGAGAAQRVELAGHGPPIRPLHTRWHYKVLPPGISLARPLCPSLSPSLPPSLPPPLPPSVRPSLPPSLLSPPSPSPSLHLPPLRVTRDRSSQPCEPPL